MQLPSIFTRFTVTVLVSAQRKTDSLHHLVSACALQRLHRRSFFFDLFRSPSTPGCGFVGCELQPPCGGTPFSIGLEHVEFDPYQDDNQLIRTRKVFVVSMFQHFSTYCTVIRTHVAGVLKIVLGTSSPVRMLGYRWPVLALG